MIPNPPTIGKIGFFQFGDSNKSEPVNSLASELDKAASIYQGVTNSLIVLPEALNVLNDYMTPSDPDPSVARGLKEISLRLGVVFVAGLVIEGRKGQCYSCGCLIDGDMCRILSCKTDDDRTHNYQPYPCVFDQPALHRGVCIAALVCNDATENPPDGNLQKRERRHEALAHETEARRQGAPAVLCHRGQRHS